MAKSFYKKTGMFIDWEQIKKLPKVDTLIDIGVGPSGTANLYKNFPKAKLILIDPLDEAKNYAKKLSKKREVVFHQMLLGNHNNITKELKLQKKRSLTSLLKISKINMISDFDRKKKVKMYKLDTILKKKKLGKIGIKIDVEGYELEVLKGSKKILKLSSFVIAEVRHNHKSLHGLYSFREFINFMSKNNFILTMILTAKPFIADLCFEKK